jgi:hypothetical protein
VIAELTNASLANDPGQAQKQHYTPYVEKATYEDTFYPSKLDDTLAVCWQIDWRACWLQQTKIAYGIIRQAAHHSLL